MGMRRYRSEHQRFDGRHQEHDEVGPRDADVGHQCRSGCADGEFVLGKLHVGHPYYPPMPKNPAMVWY